MHHQLQYQLSKVPQLLLLNLIDLNHRSLLWLKLIEILDFNYHMIGKYLKPMAKLLPLLLNK